ncbi:hypothetical protein PJ985_19145 [Streptomyces sp. ACA25]|uniref:RICIN domain-containing protein n=1 Tax=Streptomyces sp. ACA25 TaxID=3022596 RepID=UPI002306E0E9|nr:hypothetical protein [Streptomyces sp. ACA25]MDB1089676.1 hypothetical protein [Streptomyces sp. ACA25]
MRGKLRTRIGMVLSLVALAAVTQSAAAAPVESRQDSWSDVRIINSGNGGRLAVWGDATGDQATSWASVERRNIRYATERWEVVAERGGGFSLWNRGGGGDRCLSLGGEDAVWGTLVTVAPCGRSPQIWSIRAVGDGRYLITPDRTGDDTALAVHNPGHTGWSQARLLRQAVPSADRTWMISPR